MAYLADGEVDKLACPSGAEVECGCNIFQMDGGLRQGQIRPTHDTFALIGTANPVLSAQFYFSWMNAGLDFILFLLGYAQC